MEDLRRLREMGMMDQGMIDEMQEAIDLADETEKMRAAFGRIEELGRQPPQEQQIPKHRKLPLAKNAAKRARSKGEMVR